MGRIRVRVLARLAVSKCVLAVEGCASATPRLLTTCYSYFTVKPHNGAIAVEPPGTICPGTRNRPAVSRANGGADGEIGPHVPTRIHHCPGKGRSPDSALQMLELGGCADPPETGRSVQSAAIPEARLSTTSPTTTWTIRPERITPKTPAARSISSSTFVWLATSTRERVMQGSRSVMFSWPLKPATMSDTVLVAFLPRFLPSRDPRYHARGRAAEILRARDHFILSPRCPRRGVPAGRKTRAHADRRACYTADDCAGKSPSSHDGTYSRNLMEAR